MEKISCIICAYNEAGRIGKVLNVVCSHPLIDEVIVVDDGSTDQTSEEVKEYHSVRLIPFDTNRGKSYAAATGISQARNSLVMMMDADLIGLNEENVTRLVKPVLNGKTDISISLRQNSLFIYKMIKLDFVSGERVLPKAILADHLKNIRELPGFGLESYMNRLIINNHCRIAIVRWQNVTHARKSEKLGLWKGLKEEVRMLSQILKVLSLRDIIYENYKLLSLIVQRADAPE